MEKKPISIEMDKGFTNKTSKKMRPRVLFQNISTNVTSKNNISTIEDTKESSKSEERPSDIFKRPQIDKINEDSSRNSHKFLSSASEDTNRRVNFKQKGPINFSYSFLPNDIMAKSGQKKVRNAIQTLEGLLGEGKVHNLDLKNMYLKEIIAKNVNVPEIKEKNNLTLLIKNLIDRTSEKISKTRSDAIVHASYKSHKLLQQMEQKEAKFKKLQRLKELQLKHNALERRSTGGFEDNQNIKVNLKKKSTAKSYLEDLNDEDRKEPILEPNMTKKSIGLNSTKKGFQLNESGFGEILTEDNDKKNIAVGNSLCTTKFYKTTLGHPNDSSIFSKDDGHTLFSKNRVKVNIDCDLKSANKIEIVKVNTQAVNEYGEQNEYTNFKISGVDSGRFVALKNSENSSMVTTPGKHLPSSFHPNARMNICQEEEDTSRKRRKKQTSKSISYNNISCGYTKQSTNKLRHQYSVARNIKNSIYKNIAENAKNHSSNIQLSKAKIFVSGGKNKRSHGYIESYKKHFIDESLKDPNNLFRKSPSPRKASPRKIRVQGRQRKNGLYRSTNTGLAYDHDISKKNLKLYLPQIGMFSRSNSDIRSRGRR
ncbi:unnamed protein product [Moneuplotes crassus]|uniref:Uncharacterized protein n=1 Tax=Euplotes crassus TaxID=5936 RepID=A0AAD1U027_EUPCR|nr:unnamed protein product [Moneuplotes crassus]